jgi:hypothetical protein
LEGILVYFGFLLFLFVLTERVDQAKRSRRLLVFPLAIYYTTTLGIPLANGAYQQGTAFWEHSIFVLLLPMILVLPLAVIHRIKRHLVNSENHV